MEQTKQEITIVEYHEGLAAGVAEMWNASREGWGGDSHITTEEKVKVQEANSGNLNLFLAMDGDRVVGYCGLSDYKEDEGALYIPLLNVRPDYHGKKIGKLLVKRALERALELGWPRLDLYTWPGNTKAVPLYKKCGFFWEDRDDTTHLMNFLPTVLHTEAVKDFFTKIDWYGASRREIEVTPDGKKENDFTYYEYKWNDDGKSLRMEFERTARGLRTIETDDYLVTVSVEDFQLVCDATYTVRYDIKNKSGKPLHLELKGEDNKIVAFSFEHSVTVNDVETVEAQFRLHSVEEEQSNWRTHPAVVTMVTINGKQAKFAVGILPKLPAKITGILPGSQVFLNEDAHFYLDIENNVNTTATFNLTFPKQELLHLKQNEFHVKLEPKAKASIPIRYKLRSFGFYSPIIEVKVVREDGHSQQFSKQIGVGFKGLGAKFAGECDQYWHIYNGLYHLYLSKFDNKVIPGRMTKGSQATMGMFPKLGKPYSSEFSKKKPSKVEYKEENGAIVLAATYESTDFQNIELVSLSTLYSEGLVEQSYLVRNRNIHSTQEPLWIYHPIYHDLDKPVFVLSDELIRVEDKASADFGVWNSQDLTENWLFSRYESYPHGIAWPNDAKVNFESWYMYLEQNLGEIPANAEVTSKPVYYSIGAYQHWEDFREFALRKPCSKRIPIQDVMVKKTSHEVTYADHKTSYLDGKIIFNDNDVMPLKAEDKMREVSTTFEKPSTPLSTITVDYEVNGIKDYKKMLVFNPTNEVVHIQKETREKLEVLSASNNVMTIAAASSFYPTLFSLKIEGKEWLDTSFPTIQPKSWWNPWSGGIHSVLQGVSNKSSAKEKYEIAEEALVDQEGRVWKGLKISTIFTENDVYKGLGVHQYFLLLPGIPVLALVTKFDQYTGTYFHHKKWYTESCFIPGWIKDADHNRTYLCGKSEMTTYLSHHMLLGSTTDNKFLQLISDREAFENELYTNKDVTQIAMVRDLQMADGTERISSPAFIVSTDNVLSSDEVNDLQRITFKEVKK